MADHPPDNVAGGVRIRTDVVEAFLFRQVVDGGVELLQLLRIAAARISPATWQPVLGHIETGETAIDAVRREMLEETGLTREMRLGLWQLEQVHPFFIAGSNIIYLCPRFAAEVAGGWEPRLNAEHDDYRWVGLSQIDRCFAWPGQRAAIAELVREIIHPGSPCVSLLRLE